MRVGESRAPGAGTRWAALVVGIVSIALLCVYIVGSFSGWWEAMLDWDAVTNYLTMLGFLFLGQLILWRAGGNRVGWIFTAMGVMLIASAISAGLADRGLLAFSAIGGGLWLGWFLLIGVLILWFPTGQVPGRRWLWLQWLGFVLLAVTIFSYAFAEQICIAEGGGGCGAWAANPIGIPGMPNPEYGEVSGPLLAFYPVFLGGAVLSLVMRYRKSVRVERLQLKWFLLACASLLAAMLSEMVTTSQGVEETPFLIDAWISLSLVAVPIAATLAILRYRLYDIDKIISKTVSYVVVVATLALVYVLGLTALTGLLETESPLAVAGSTLATAALFNPLRKRVQAAVDHRFNRSRYDAVRVMTGFAGSLRDEVDPNAVVSGWVSVVNETMRPASAGVWVRNQS